MAKKKTALAIQTSTSAVFVYVGPSIRGIIQQGTIYAGTREEVLKSISPAIEKYPDIKKLVVADYNIVSARSKIKSGINALSIAYKALSAE